MSQCRILPFILAVWSTVAWPAAAQVTGPVCGSPDVLAVVAEMLHRTGQAIIIDTAAAEAPAAQPGVVRCAVRVHTLFHDTNRFGPVAADQVRTYRYAITLRKNGIFVEAEPW